MSYNQSLCDKLELKKMISREIIDDVIKKYTIENVKGRKITKKIKSLRKELQKKIYIYSLKFFYRENFKNKPLYSIHNRYVGVINEMKKKKRSWS